MRDLRQSYRRIRSVRLMERTWVVAEVIFGVVCLVFPVNMWVWYAGTFGATVIFIGTLFLLEELSDAPFG